MARAVERGALREPWAVALLAAAPAVVQVLRAPVTHLEEGMGVSGMPWYLRLLRLS